MRGPVAVFFSGITLAAGSLLAQTDGWQTYRDGVLGIEFRYPALYVLKEAQDPDGRLRSIALQSFSGDTTLQPVIELTVAVEGQASGIPFLPPPSPRRTALDLAMTVAMARCRAEVPPGLTGAWRRLTGSTRCTAAREVEVTTTSGVKGYALYLTQVFDFSDAQRLSETRTKGPIYTFDISAGESVRVILLSLTEAGDRLPQHRQVLQEISRTVAVSAAR